jgi:hypothetical protein
VNVHYDLPTLTTQPSLNSRINIRGMLPDRPGRFGDGIIGAQALENNMTLITNDKALKAAIQALGGLQDDRTAEHRCKRK